MLPRRFLLRFFELGARRFWLHLIPVIVLSLAGVAFLFIPVYVTHAAIYVQRNTLLGELVSIRIRDDLFNGVQILTSATMTVTELKELIQTDAFAFAVISQSALADELNGSDDQVRRVLKLYREATTITAGGDNLVQIEIETDDPNLAYQFANGTVEAFRSWKMSKDVQDSQIAQAFFEEVEVAYREDVERTQADLRDYLERYPEPAVGTRPVEELFELEQFQSAVQLAEVRLKDVLDKSESARIALAQSQSEVDQVYRLIDPPRAPTASEPFYEQLWLALIFPAVGIMLAIVMVLGRVAAERSLLNEVDVHAELDLPLLASVAAPRRQRGKKAKPNQQPTPRNSRPEDALAGPVRP